MSNAGGTTARRVCVLALLLAVVCYTVTSSTNAQRDVINIVYFAPGDHRFLFSRYRAGAAIEYAIKNVTQSLLPGKNITTHYADSKCDSKSAPLAAFDWSKNASVFLGPVCDYSVAPVARYAPHWNIPVITPGAMAHDFGSNKSDPRAEFPRLTRVGATFNDIADQVHFLLKKYNWTKLTILYDSKGLDNILQSYCYLMVSALGWYLKYQVVPTIDLRQSSIRPEDGIPGYEKLLVEDVGISKSSE